MSDPEIRSPFVVSPSKARRVFPPPFTQATRQRVLSALARGESIEQAAADAGTSTEPVVVVIRELAAAELGHVLPDEPDEPAATEPSEIERKLTAAATAFCLEGEP